MWNDNYLMLQNNKTDNFNSNKNIHLYNDYKKQSN